MKKSLFFAAAAAVMALASCSSEDAISQSAPVANDAVGFGVYQNGVGSKALNTCERDLQADGFGVFAYSTEQASIKDYLNTNYVPNFMYNQMVNKPGTSEWVYSPVKYWPNNPGALVSFYAYAPYIPEFNEDEYTNTPDNNNILSNVKYVDDYNVRLQLGKDYQGPGIEYLVPGDPTKGIDLLWGCEQGAEKAPINKPKPNVGETIKFNFKHALSRLHFNVQVWVDEVASGDVANSEKGLAEGTVIKIEKVELVGKIAKAGTLRLLDGSWNVESGNYADVVFADTMLNAAVDSIALDKASQEIDLLRGHSMENGELIDEEDIDNFVMLIPGSQFYIRLTYTVTTTDPENPKNTSVVRNVINSTDSNVKIYDLPNTQGPAFDNEGKVLLQAGNAYDFHLNIGMTSVKFEAEVTDWNRLGNEIDMPENY